jgi:hypothetical protein
MKKIKIPRGHFPEFTHDVDVTYDDDKFDLVPERFPPGLADKTHNGKKVRWISNFSLNKKPGVPVTGKKVKYTLELDKQTGVLVYFDGNSVLLLPFTDWNNGRVSAELEADDPGVGWVG